MSVLTGKGATIKNRNCLTFGLPCVIAEYDRKLKKYRVDFDNSWHGWYKRSELKVDEV